MGKKVSAIPTVLTIAGSDSSGGAGLQADLKTITCLGCYGMSVVTALTAQNTLGVQDIFSVSAEFVEKQIESVCSDIPPMAVKIGMVYDIPQIQKIAEMLRKFSIPFVVIDPVMFSTSGDSLLKKQALNTLQQVLFPLSDLLTPNIPEAERLLETSIDTSIEMEQAAKTLSQRYHTAVLLKGGHSAERAVDFLSSERGLQRLREKPIETENTHGTGCTLSAGIAAYVAKGYTLEDSVFKAKAYLTGALKAGLEIGHGNGPLMHNYCIRKEENS
ncbi:MAG: bifunctional hydroxymethylpyrimidine kinase/phosphomethylpyrimidine kinase [Ruminococcus sp.]|nr:bifunctional hydroxymethylpyrimidine kinase/phosphomethylpyrimidine kinase [Ruminococcus sp.]